MYFTTDVVKHMLIINVLMFAGTFLLGNPDPALMSDLVNQNITSFSDWGRYRLALFFPGSDYFRPYQFVSHMFMHADLTHLFFNMFGLFMFGPPLEMRWGAKKFLVFYLITGFGAMGLHLLVNWIQMNYGDGSPFLANVPVLGASGVVFGLLAGYAIEFPNNVIQLLFPPIPMRAKYFVLIYAALELFLGLGNFNTGVAHFAHLGGALFGFLLLMYWYRTRRL